MGKIVRIKRAPFTVVGVLESKGQSPNGQDQDDTVILPVTTLLKKLAGSAHSRSIGVVLVQAVDGDSVKEAEREVTSLLRQRHRIGPGQDDDFSVRNLSEMLALAESATRIMSLLLGGIASVSLVVGGIGIMNIMLVSVTERTREIGIRMAVGARERDILSQFLIEAVLLALTGGAIGIVLGSGRGDPHFPDRRLVHAHLARGRAPRLRLLRSGGRLLRLLPGAQGVADGPHRGPPVRVNAKLVPGSHSGGAGNRSVMLACAGPFWRDGRRALTRTSVTGPFGGRP